MNEKCRILRAGEARITQNYLKHIQKKNQGIGWALGTDIVKAPADLEKITAHSDGVVIWAGLDHTVDGYGMFVMVEHADKYVTLYAHMASVLVDEGETVHAGDVIGSMGATGNAQGAHLHWELRRYNSLIRGSYHDTTKFIWMDPEPYINADFLTPTIYRVQTGAYKFKAFAVMAAEKLDVKLRKAGYSVRPIIKLYNDYYHVQVGAFVQKENAVTFAKHMEEDLNVNTYITTGNGQDISY